MPLLTYLVVLKQPPGAIEKVRASRFEMGEEHLVFTNEQGQLAGLFLVDIVESFSVIES